MYFAEQYSNVQPEMNVTMLGIALRMIIPKIIGEGLSSWFELVKPLVEFKWDVINTRINSMFELATQEVFCSTQRPTEFCNFRKWTSWESLREAAPESSAAS